MARGRWRTFPVVYEVNALVWLGELSRRTGAKVTLGNVPEAELKRLARYGFDALWLMGVWQRSPRGCDLDRKNTALITECHKVLPDFTLNDIAGSPYAVYRYQTDPALGTDDELQVLRGRLRDLGMRLILDFVPNHLACDHSWLAEHPERFVQGTRDDLLRAPGNYFHGPNGRIFAHGRDPNFSGWPDTAQLDYRNRATRDAMCEALLTMSDCCDGVRCDMAMLVTEDVFTGTWGGQLDSPGVGFWADAIARVKRHNSDFLMLAEVYWDQEYKLQQMGFDYTYDKRLYDRLKAGDAAGVQSHLCADLGFQRHLTRFIENHDEERAMHAFESQERARAVAALALNLPGMRLFHAGQIEGHRIRLPVQLGRSRREEPEPGIKQFYERLLAALRDPVLHDGQWQLLDPKPAWPENQSHRKFVAYHWVLGDGVWLVAVNLSSSPAQCFLSLDLPVLRDRSWYLYDVLNEVEYARAGHELLTRGLYLDVPANYGHLFHFELQSRSGSLDPEN